VSGLEILGAPNASTIVLVRLFESGGLADAAPGACHLGSQGNSEHS